MGIFNLFMFGGKKTSRAATTKSPCRPQVESLESRVVPYAVSGTKWVNQDLITISFVPDGTNLNGYSSNLFATMNAKFGSAATWQNQILKAAQQWALQTNINFSVKTDNGGALGSGSYQQGDPGFGDIRIGGYNFGNTTLAQAYLPPTVNNYSVAGDIQFNTGQTFNIGSTYDLYTVAMHEIGHALGLYHGATGSVMAASYVGTKTALATDDISGIRNIYSANAVRSKDVYDAAASNEKSATARDITSLINATTKTALITNMDLSTSTDVDYYKIVVPTGSSSNLKVNVVSQGLSLLAPKLDIYNSSNVLKASANGANQYGTTISATATGVTAGQTYYIKVSSADSITAFKTGKYALVVNLGTGSDPAVPLPTTSIANGSPLTSGGGQAFAYGTETRVNTTPTGTQLTGSGGRRSVASDIDGNYVVTWASQSSTSGWDIYAQRYNRGGVAQGSEIRVNSTTTGDQTDPAVAIDIAGDFIVSWTAQDGAGTGVFAQLFNSDGTKIGGEFRVNATTTGDQKEAVVATDAWGRIIVSWTSVGQDGSGSGIYARNFDSMGVATGNEFRVNSTTNSDQTRSAVGVNRITGDFTVSWSSAGQDGSGLGVFAQRFTWGGTAQGSEFRVNATTSGDQTDAAISMNRFTGDIVVTWSSNGQDGNGWGIYGQRYDSNGMAQGSEFRVNTTTTGDQTTSSLATDSGGNFLVVWTSVGQDGSGSGVYGQLFAANGTKRESEFRVNNTTSGEQSSATVAIDFLGQAVVVWSGNGTGDSSGVFFQRYNLDKEFYYAEGQDHSHDELEAHHDDTPTDVNDPSAFQFVATSDHPSRVGLARAEEVHARNEERRNERNQQPPHCGTPSTDETENSLDSPGIESNEEPDLDGVIDAVSEVLVEFTSQAG